MATAKKAAPKKVPAKKTATKSGGFKKPAAKKAVVKEEKSIPNYRKDKTTVTNTKTGKLAMSGVIMESGTWALNAEGGVAGVYLNFMGEPEVAAALDRLAKARDKKPHQECMRAVREYVSRAGYL